MRFFWRVLGGIILHPGGTFTALSSSPRRFRDGIRAMLGVGVLYAATAALLGAGGALVTAPAVIAFAPQNYYFFQMIFALPVLVGAWLMASLAAGALARLFRGRGGWKTTAAGLAFAFAPPCLMIWILQTVFGVLLHAGMPQAEFMDLLARPGWLQTAGWTYHALAVAWMLVLSTEAVRTGHRLSRLKAAAVAAPVSALFIAVFLVFIR